VAKLVAPDAPTVERAEPLPLTIREADRVAKTRASRICDLVYHGYTACMAKVMVSIPDDLLAEVDSEAARTGTSRSAVLRGFADGALRDRRSRRAETMADLLDRAGNHGGDAAEAVKATRPK
jgi:hypothetical protein